MLHVKTNTPQGIYLKGSWMTSQQALELVVAAARKWYEHEAIWAGSPEEYMRPLDEAVALLRGEEP